MSYIAPKNRKFLIMSKRDTPRRADCHKLETSKRYEAGFGWESIESKMTY